MTAVDTGWINDENPRERAARTAERHHFQTPIDEVDAAARVLHPVFEGVPRASPCWRLPQGLRGDRVVRPRCTDILNSGPGPGLETLFLLE